MDVVLSQIVKGQLSGLVKMSNIRISEYQNLTATPSGGGVCIIVRRENLTEMKERLRTAEI